MSCRLLSHIPVTDTNFTTCEIFDTQEGVRDGDGSWCLSLVLRYQNHSSDGGLNPVMNIHSCTKVGHALDS